MKHLTIPVWTKIMFGLWMVIVIFVHLLLFGPPEFWLFIERLGLLGLLQGWASWLAPFFTAGYLS